VGFLSVCIASLVVIGVGLLFLSSVSVNDWSGLIPGLMLVLSAGVTQLILVIPLAVWARKKPRFLKGVAIAALLTFALNLACVTYISFT
jgi:ABC-type proline/glycine betaine transport system permease subunit